MLLHVVKKNQYEEKRRGKGRYQKLRNRDNENGTERECVLEKERGRLGFEGRLAIRENKVEYKKFYINVFHSYINIVF